MCRGGREARRGDQLPRLVCQRRALRYRSLSEVERQESPFVLHPGAVTADLDMHKELGFCISNLQGKLWSLGTFSMECE